MTRRSRWLIASLMCAVAVALCFIGFRRIKARQTPPLEITPAVINLGSVPEGTAITRSFLLRNNGSDSLTVARTTTSCGCTVVVLNQRTLAPGQSTQVNVTFNSKGFGGTIAKSFVVIPSDERVGPAHGQLVATVVSGRPGLDSSEIRLGSVHFGESFSRKLLASFNSTQRLMRARAVDDPSSHIRVALGELRPGVGSDDAKREIVVHVGPIVDAPGEYNRSAAVDLGDGERLPIQILYRVAPSLEAMPAALWIDSSPSQATAVLRAAGGASGLTIDRATVEGEGLVASVSRIAGTDEWEVRVVTDRVRPQSSNRPALVRIQYWLDPAKLRTEQLVIPVYFMSSPHQ